MTISHHVFQWIIAWFGFTLTLSVSLSVHGAGSFKTGWWTDIQKTNQLSQYAVDGSTIVLALSGGWFTDASGRPIIQKFLDTAADNELKVIVSLVRKNSTPDKIPADEFVTTVNAFKNHPALYGWYIGDEPERYKGGWQITHSNLAADPGYYRLLRSIDPDHPAMISFDMIHDPYEKYWARISNFYDVSDMIGMHNYPFWSPPGYLAEFSGASTRTQYDKWKYAFEKTKLSKKPGFIATAQGFGYQTKDSIYRDPTYNELRYQVFSAIVQGIDHVLFWYDGWSNDWTKNLVKQIIGQIQHIGKEMNAGITNDMKVNTSIADRNQLVYRYGTNGTRHVILSVNIANRMSSSGATLPDVQFSLPPMIRPPQITVAFENRTLSVSADNSFRDTFKPFAVHIYAFETATDTHPPNSPPGVKK